MHIDLKRFQDDGDTTLGALFVNGVFNCFIVEDQQQTKKVWGEMRIPEGTYDISLRKSGGFHNRYSVKFADMHKGMLCIHNAPEWKIIQGDITFQYVLIHIGNTDEDTAGCLLPNEAVNSRTMKGSGSTNAYKKLYPIITEELLLGRKVKITITDIENGGNAKD
jgi:hypothetical protein